MPGRIVIREGDAAAEPADFHVAAADDVADEQALREALRGALETARSRGARVVAAPAIGAASLPLQRRAELLLEEARRHLATPTCVEEIRFVVAGEPAYRVFESVQDAARVAEQMARLERAERSS
jgi:O-acetyl-ADP-ribose deacetylase (regulator of RNase III)